MGFDSNRVRSRDFNITRCSSMLVWISDGKSLITVLRIFNVILSIEDLSDRSISNRIFFNAVSMIESFDCLPWFCNAVAQQWVLDFSNHRFVLQSSLGLDCFLA